MTAIPPAPAARLQGNFQQNKDSNTGTDETRPTPRERVAGQLPAEQGFQQEDREVFEALAQRLQGNFQQNKDSNDTTI